MEQRDQVEPVLAAEITQQQILGQVEVAAPLPEVAEPGVLAS
jgi:hypothetical protein